MSDPGGRSLNVLGVRIDAVSRSEAVATLVGYVRSGTPHQIVTVNPEFLVQAQSDAGFRSCLNQAHLALADGVGLLVAARVLGRPLPGRVTGVDVTLDLMAACAKQGYRVFLLGAANGVAEQAASVLVGQFPELQIVGCHAGSPQPEADAQQVERIRGTSPHVLLVAYGAPAQDLWIARNLEALAVPVAIGVGGTFDYLSGRVPRAPGLLRSLGFEWLYRLVRQPWRWRRQLRLPVFVWLVLCQRGAKVQR